MNFPNEKAEINTNKIERSFTYDNKVMLNLDIEYPSIILKNSVVQTRINLHYNNVAKNFQRYAVKTLFPQAIEQYKYSQENGFPFFPYDAVLRYTVTLNGSCTLST